MIEFLIKDYCANLILLICICIFITLGVMLYISIKGDQKKECHGKWQCYDGDYKCSQCETVFTDELLYVIKSSDILVPYYCPYCGAKMDGDAE